MTSGEALKYIYSNQKSSEDKIWLEAFIKIIKDIEMLELIKKLFVYDEYMGFDIDFRKLKESERNEIKEWLEK